MILWWFACCRITGNTLTLSVHGRPCTALLGPVIMFCQGGKLLCFLRWRLSVKNHQQIGLELPLKKLSPLKEGQKDLLALLRRCHDTTRKVLAWELLLCTFFFSPTEIQDDNSKLCSLGNKLGCAPIWCNNWPISQFSLLVWWNSACFALDKLIHYALIENNMYLKILNHFTDIKPVGGWVVTPMEWPWFQRSNGIQAFCVSAVQKEWKINISAHMFSCFQIS